LSEKPIGNGSLRKAFFASLSRPAVQYVLRISKAKTWCARLPATITFMTGASCVGFSKIGRSLTAQTARDFLLELDF
jgi:hypothetical protein